MDKEGIATKAILGIRSANIEARLEELESYPHKDDLVKNAEFYFSFSQKLIESSIQESNKLISYLLNGNLGGVVAAAALYQQLHATNFRFAVFVSIIWFTFGALVGLFALITTLKVRNYQSTSYERHGFQCMSNARIQAFDKSGISNITLDLFDSKDQLVIEFLREYKRFKTFKSEFDDSTNEMEKGLNSLLIITILSLICFAFALLNPIYVALFGVVFEFSPSGLPVF